jgi:4'-phosphopantetheinyl transferase
MSTPATQTTYQVDTIWHSQARFTPLQENEVHIWLANLDLEIFALPKYLRDLSLGERSRAQRLRFDHDRRRFVLAKGLLRQLLGGYLKLEPHDVQFTNGPSGKPELSRRLLEQHQVQFNQAHSGNIGIFAFCKNRRVGIDVEEVRVFPDIEQIAEMLFSPHELELFRALPDSEKKSTFFRAWTHKEAFVKALGKGLTLPLSHFEVSSVGAHLARIVQNHDHPPRHLEWYVREIPVSPHFAAAVCVEGEGWRLRCWKW